MKRITLLSKSNNSRWNSKKDYNKKFGWLGKTRASTPKRKRGGSCDLKFEQFYFIPSTPCHALIEFVLTFTRFFQCVSTLSRCFRLFVDKNTKKKNVEAILCRDCFKFYKATKKYRKVMTLPTSSLLTSLLEVLVYSYSPQCQYFVDGLRQGLIEKFFINTQIHKKLFIRKLL